MIYPPLAIAVIAANWPLLSIDLMRAVTETAGAGPDRDRGSREESRLTR